VPLTVDTVYAGRVLPPPLVPCDPISGTGGPLSAILIPQAVPRAFSTAGVHVTPAPDLDRVIRTAVPLAEAVRNRNLVHQLVNRTTYVQREAASFAPHAVSDATLRKKAAAAVRKEQGQRMMASLTAARKRKAEEDARRKKERTETQERMQMAHRQAEEKIMAMQRKYAEEEARVRAVQEAEEARLREQRRQEDMAAY